ncbi:hypothetical protein PENTCL1PPCAC_9927, partial [Pristionchus entomophagus]
RMPVPAIGIDLGTTFTAVSYVENGTAKIIQNNAGHEITPSVVHFDEDIEGSHNEHHFQSDHYKDLSESCDISDIKRIMGRRHDDVFLKQRKFPFEIVRGNNDRASIRVDAEIYSPEQISAIILKYMK